MSVVLRFGAVEHITATQGSALPRTDPQDAPAAVEHIALEDRLGASAILLMNVRHINRQAVFSALGPESITLCNDVGWVVQGRLEPTGWNAPP